MARFLCTVWPFPGHLYPTLAVAHALRARGHEVGFYSGEAVRQVIEAEGFLFFPFDRVATRLQEVVDGAPAGRPNGDDAAFYERLTARYSPSGHGTGLARLRSVRATYKEWIIGTIPSQVADLEAIVDEWWPDVVLTDPILWAPFVVLYEARGLQVAIFSFLAGCLVPGPDVPLFGPGLPRLRNRYSRVYARVVAAGLGLLTADVRRAPDAVRRRYGLAPLQESVMAFMARVPLHLVATAREYDYARSDVPPSIQYVGACLWDKPSRDALPTWLGNLPAGRPVVYVTEGTSHVHDAVLLRAAARGLAGLPLDAILTTGRGRDPDDLDLTRLAANVRVERYIPHSDLFPRLSAVVTNGGSSTVRAALCAGLPLVIVPMEWDQFDNAQRVVDAGAGVRLSARHCTPEKLRLAVQRVLQEPTYQANAQRLARAFARYRGSDRAAELLEGLALSDVEQERRHARPTTNSALTVASGATGREMEGRL